MASSTIYICTLCTAIRTLGLRLFYTSLPSNYNKFSLNLDQIKYNRIIFRTHAIAFWP